MKIRTSFFVVLLAAAPAALAHSVSIMSAQPRSPFINYAIPTGGTAVLQEIQGPRGGMLWQLSGAASDSLYTFTFNFDHTQSPNDFYAYSPLSFVGNGVRYSGTIIHVHLDSSGLLTGGWTGGRSHGRLTLQLYSSGTGCSTNPTAQCLTIGSGTFSVATAPEPASLTLIATGLMSFVVTTRRKIRGTHSTKKQQS